MASSSSSDQGTLREAPFSVSGYQPDIEGFSRSPRIWDVFINHRGPDVKETLALQLYKYLENRGIRAFHDREELELGDSFPSVLQDAIRLALVQIAIFSKGYADSPWCLAELDLVLHSNKTIIPIFYGVTPSDLRWWEKGAYANSFNKYNEKGRYLKNLDKWKENLCRASFIKGHELCHDTSDLGDLCEMVVSAVKKELQKARPLEVAKYPVGITEILQDFESTCCLERERTQKIIGICGLPGSGKTTLAASFFNRIRSEYSESSFLYNVRERFKNSNLTSYQSQLLNDLFHESRKFYSIPDGSNYLKERLRRRPDLKFLICIDDMDDPEHLDALVGRDVWDNATSSLIIVTSRDRRVLIRAGVTACYQMKLMNPRLSTELFCWSAFHQNDPVRGYEKLVENFVEACGGLPLSLQVMGGLVFDKSGPKEKYWRGVLEEMKGTLPDKIEKMLMISFKALKDEQKKIFLDISCIFVDRSSHLATRIWEGSGWNAEHTLQSLIDKCLVDIYMGSDRWMGVESGSIPLLRMHDHVRDLGRQVAANMGSPRRLWTPRDLRSQQEKGFERVLKESAANSFRCLNSIFEFRYFLGNSIDDFDGESTCLLLLELDLRMVETMVDREENTSIVPSSYNIPPWIPLQNLQCLKILGGHLERLWDTQFPSLLKELVLDGIMLEEFPDSLGWISHLEVLFVRGRAVWSGTEWIYPMQIDGTAFSNSLTELTNLRALVLRDLTLSGELTLKSRGESSGVANLESLDIRDVKLASRLVISAGYLHSLKSILLESMENLMEVSLESDTEEYSEAEELSNCASQQYCLEQFIIDGCWALQMIKGIENLEGLKCLQISASTPFLPEYLRSRQKWPSQIAMIIWSPASKQVSFDDLKWDWCDQDKGVATIAQFDNISINEIKVGLAVTVQPIAVMIVMSLHMNGNGQHEKDLKMPLLNWRVSYVANGSNVVVVAVTGKDKISKMLSEPSNCLPTITNGQIVCGRIMTIETIEGLESFSNLVIEHHLKYEAKIEGFSLSNISDVFISYRGFGVNKAFILHLYNCLEDRGIRAFYDRQELELGDSLPSVLQDAIRFARVQIVILSTLYLHSPWCLAELDLMLRSNKTVIPIFYHATRQKFNKKVNSLNRYHTKGRHLNNFDKWKENLNRASFLEGYELHHGGRDLREKVVSAVVSAVEKELEKTRPLKVAKTR